MGAVRRLDITHPASIPENSGEAIGLTKGLAPVQLIDVIRGSDLCHIVQTDGLRFDGECQAAEKMLTDPQSFLSSPLETIFGATFKTVIPFAMTVDASVKKALPLTEFSKYMVHLNESESVTEVALMAADELYTNASKNAWPAEAGLFQGPAVNPGKIDFFAAADKEFLAIGCRDSYGRLDLRTLIERIRICYENGVANSIQWGTGGAGIGSFMVFDACLSFYAAVDPGKMTLVCITLPRKRRGSDSPKNIHLLSLPKAEE